MKMHLSAMQDNRYREFDIYGKWGTRMLELFPVFKTKSVQSSNDRLVLPVRPLGDRKDPVLLFCSNTS
jgi:hypothetical protein